MVPHICECAVGYSSSYVEFRNCKTFFFCSEMVMMINFNAIVKKIENRDFGETPPPDSMMRVVRSPALPRRAPARCAKRLTIIIESGGGVAAVNLPEHHHCPGGEGLPLYAGARGRVDVYRTRFAGFSQWCALSSPLQNFRGRGVT